MKRKSNALFLTRGAVIAAIYVTLTYLSHVFGLASGVVQLRLSEALCVLPAFLPEAVPGLTIGCLISNLVTGCAPWDVVFGALATFLGAVGARLFARLANKSRLLAFIIPLPTVISNTLIIPFVLRYAYGAPDALPFMMLTVGAGELLSALVLGMLLYFSIKKIFGRK
ncbi:MAG: QueT transporter family protein [Clostridia bacterium]|nr:QueT transporter family protein [Clostridia bacterium]